jgi:hypothetical protein
MVATRVRYVEATVRLERALADWQSAAVRLEAGVPWTPDQLTATENVAAAWAELVRRRREWDAVLRELGYQR